MTPSTLAETDVKLLKEPVFDVPKERPAGDFGTFLERTYAAFFARLQHFHEPLASLLRPRIDRMRSLADAIVSAWRHGSTGDWTRADSELAGAMKGVREELVSMSRRHTAKVLPGQSWYRLSSWDGVKSRKHMFHMPFEAAQKSYRFSTPGTPTLYLGNSVYLCWLECGEPAAEKCSVSRFEIDAGGFEFLDLPCSHQAYVDPLDFPDIPGLDADPRSLMNSPYMTDVLAELAGYLTVWPLLAAVSVTKLQPEPASPPEYVIPQLLMRWTRNDATFLGIRYFTSKPDPSTNSQDWSVCLALPARTTKESGYCDFLQARIRCTAPQRLSAMRDKTLKELVTREAGDRRQAAHGRYMLRRPDGRMQEYVTTEFGKMEYWLDRPELPVASIAEE